MNRPSQRLAQYLRRPAGAMTALLLVLLLTAPYIGLGRFMNYFILGMLFVAMTQVWALLAGSLGEISFGQAAFFGIGAYTVALNYSPGGYLPRIPIPLDILLGAVNAAIIAGIAGYPLLRLRGIYFAVSVIALQEILRVYFLASNNVWIVPPFFGYYGRGGGGFRIPVI